MTAKILPEEHQSAYAEYCRVQNEYGRAVSQYRRDLEAYKVREIERASVERANRQVYNKIREAEVASEEQIKIQAAKPTTQPEEPAVEQPEEPVTQPEPQTESSEGWGLFDIFSMRAYAFEQEGSQSPKEPQKGFWDGVGEVVGGVVGSVLDLVSIKVYAPGPEDIITYDDVNEIQEELNKVQELESQLPTEEGIRSMLADQVAEYRRQMRPMPGKLQLPVFPPEPDWKSIGWEALGGANLFDSVLARFIPPCLSAYDKSPYRSQSRILSSREAHCFDIVEKAELDRLAKEISDKIHPNRPRSSINWRSIGRTTLIVGGAVILTAANVASGGTLTPLQVALMAGASGAVIEGGSEILDELHDGEPINWGAVAARTVGGGTKGVMFSVPGLGTAKLAAGTVGIATAENYLHSAAKGDVSAEALGKDLADGTIEGVTAGLVDVAAKKVLGAQTHAEPKPRPELQMQPMSEVEQGSYLKPDIQLFAEKAESMTRVGRWMCREEYEKMLKTGYVQESTSSTTHVASPASINAFGKQAKPGSLYVEFDVPTASIKATSKEWAKILGPNTPESRLQILKGLEPYKMPQAINIEIVGRK